MPKNLKQYWKTLQKIRLSKDEKQALYQNIAFVMAKNPIPDTAPKRHLFFSLLFVKRPFAFATLIVFFVVFSGGGISYAATNAQPNDLLYPVKVHVNEEIVGALQFTPKAKSTWEMERVRRRLAEIEKMAEEGTLTPEIEMQMSKKLENHSKKVQKFIKKFEDEGNTGDAGNAKIHLKNVFEQHQEILKNLSANGPQKPPLDMVLKVIEENGGELPPPSFKFQQQEENEDGTTLSMPKENAETEEQDSQIIIQNITQKHMDGVTQKMNLLGTTLTNIEQQSPEVAAELQIKYDQITALTTQAQEKMSAEEYDAAMVLLQQAKALLEESHTIIQTTAPKPPFMEQKMQQEEQSGEPTEGIVSE